MSETQPVSNGNAAAEEPSVDPSDEKTEQGIVVSVKEGFGFLRWVFVLHKLFQLLLFFKIAFNRRTIDVLCRRCHRQTARQSI